MRSLSGSCRDAARRSKFREKASEVGSRRHEYTCARLFRARIYASTLLHRVIVAFMLSSRVADSSGAASHSDYYD